MPQTKIALRPGIDVEKTPTLNVGGLSESNLIRFREGLPEKLGGWQRISPTPLVGVCRALHGWADLLGNDYLAAGTNERLQILTPSGLLDITPIVATSNLTSAFTTVIDTPEVEIEDAAFGGKVGDAIEIHIPIAVGGLNLVGIYVIDDVIDSTHYTFNAGTNATSSESGAGHTAEYATTMSSTTIGVTFINHGLVVNDLYSVTVSTTVGGLVIFGQYVVETVADDDHFTITAASGASSTDTGFENADVAIVNYLLEPGFASTAPSVGYGAGAYGLGPWGGGGDYGGVTPLRIWSLDNFGQDLIATPSGGSIYLWTPPPAFGGNPAALMSNNAPEFNFGTMVAMPEEIIVAFGASLPMAAALDPMLLRWCDAGDFDDWTASTTNQAGSFRLSRGSKIVRALQAPQMIMIWTDIDLWLMQYIQPPLVFGFTQAGSNCSLIAQQAVTILGTAVYWMSEKGFFTFSSEGVNPLACSVWDIVYQNLDTANADKCQAASNSLFNEVAFFFPSLSGGTGEIDSYVKYNALEQAWDYCEPGALVRTAWIDQSVLGPPIGVDQNNLLQQHETSLDADGQPMTGVTFMSGYADITGGQHFIFVDQIIPDFKWEGSNPSISVTLYFTNWPGDTPTIQGPFTVTPQTEYISFRLRARQVAMKIECDGLGVWFRLGAPRMRASSAGSV